MPLLWANYYSVELDKLENKNSTIESVKSKLNIDTIKSKLPTKEKLIEYYKMANPKPIKGVDVLTDYLVRVLILLFPLYIYEYVAVLQLAQKDLLAGIIIVIMSIWCAYKAIIGRYAKKLLLTKTNLAILAAFLLIFLSFLVQLSHVSNETAHTYLFLGCFLIPFCVSFIGKGTRYYLNLFLAAMSIFYVSIYRYIFTGKPTLIGSEQLLERPDRLIPLLMCSCFITAFLYLTESAEKKQKMYLVLLSLGLVVFFLYGNMIAFCILLLFFMTMQFFDRPTVAFMKKNMILVFLYGFCASNAPLITYFNAQGITKTFDLEYSIYIDIVIAVLGLIVTSYWEKLPKDKDADNIVMVRFSKWYRRSISILIILMALSFVFGSRGNELSDAIGGKALMGFSTSLWNSISKSNGELWHVLSVYGILGVAVMFVLGSVILKRLIDLWNGTEDILSKGYIMIAVMFLLQGFFFPYSVTSTPIYVIFLGFALYTENAKENVAEENVDSEDEIEIIDLNQTIWAGSSAASLVNEEKKEKSSIWLPTHLNSDKEEKKSSSIIQKWSEKTPEQKQDLFQKTIHRGIVYLGATMAAALIILLVMSVHQIIIPYQQVEGSKTMVEYAIENRELELLTQVELDTDGENIDPEVQDNIDTEGGVDNLDPGNGDNNSEDLLVVNEESGNEISTEEETVEAEEEQQEEEQQEEEQIVEEDEGDTELTENIPAGVSGGDYQVYDPNATYSEVDQLVTGINGAVNLRNIPRVEESEVVHKLGAEETIRRIGIGENGWSKLEYNGVVVYGVSEYLTEASEALEEEGEGEQQTEEQQTEEQQPEDNNQQVENAEEVQQEETQVRSKDPTAYSVSWSVDNKSCSIWSSGKLQGTMTVTDEAGTQKAMTYYGIYYKGSGKDQKRYFYISAPQGEGELSINVDSGFVESLKIMGYSGLYFNEKIQNW